MLSVNKVKVDSRKETYSVSKLKSLNICSKLYFYRYIERIKVSSYSVATIIGSLLHGALEIYLSDDSKSFIEVFEEQSRVTLLRKEYINQKIEESYYNKLYSSLLEYSKCIRSLYFRASANYSGSNPIRKRDGGIASNPTLTSGWKEAEKNLKLRERREDLEYEFKQITNISEVSIVEAFSEAYTLACDYVNPPELIETLALEFPISQYDYKEEVLLNPLLMPKEYGGEDNIHLNCIIDWVGYVDYKGKKSFAVVDHKTSQEDVSEDEVEYNSQLLTYVYAIENLLDVEVEVIGIHSLRHKKLVLCPVNREILKSVTESLFSKHLKIKSNLFCKDHSPDSKYSPCNNQFQSPCPYLEYCYPNYFRKKNPDSINAQIMQLLET